MTAEQLEHALTKAFRMGAASIAVPDCAAETKAEFAGFVLDQCAALAAQDEAITWVTEGVQQIIAERDALKAAQQPEQFVEVGRFINYDGAQWAKVDAPYVNDPDVVTLYKRAG